MTIGFSRITHHDFQWPLLKHATVLNCLKPQLYTTGLDQCPFCLLSSKKFFDLIFNHFDKCFFCFSIGVYWVCSWRETMIVRFSFTCIDVWINFDRIILNALGRRIQCMHIPFHLDDQHFTHKSVRQGSLLHDKITKNFRKEKLFIWRNIW